jgi:hypothetical protein
MEGYSLPFESQPINSLDILLGAVRILENQNPCFKKKTNNFDFTDILKNVIQLIENELQDKKSVELEIIIEQVETNLAIQFSSEEEKEVYLQELRFQIQDNLWGIIILSSYILIFLQKILPPDPPKFLPTPNFGGSDFWS